MEAVVVGSSILRPPRPVGKENRVLSTEDVSKSNRVGNN
jgi:hypothetical protein